MDANKKKSKRRLRRKLHIRKKVSGSAERPRLTISRSLSNMYCQVIDDDRGLTLASASTRSPELKDNLGGKGGNIAAATSVGELIAKKCQDLGLKSVVFDRNGYKYHGRIAALAAAVRNAGIEV